MANPVEITCKTHRKSQCKSRVKFCANLHSIQSKCVNPHFFTVFFQLSRPFIHHSPIPVLSNFIHISTAPTNTNTTLIY